MTRSLLACLPGLAGLVLGSGCCWDRAHVAAPAASPPPPALVGRSNMEATLLTQAAQLGEALSPSTPRPLSHTYRSVSLQEAQCLAARHAPLAELLDQERQALAEQNERSCDLLNRREDEQRELQMIVLLYSALEIRNQTAGLALEGYLALAGAEAKAEMLHIGLSEVGKAIQRTQDLRKQGLKAPVELDTLLKQEIDSRLDEAHNQMLLHRLNSELLKAMKFEADCDEWRIWPDPALHQAGDHCPDVNAAIARGLAVRPKLVLIRQVIPRVNRRTIESARLMLQSINALLGSTSEAAPIPGVALLTKLLAIGPEARQVDLVKAELQAYLRDEEKAVATEIRLALTELQVRQQVVGLARKRLQLVHERLQDLKQVQAQGGLNYAEQLAANVEWYKARGELIKELLLWRVADVKLRQAQGLLVLECNTQPGCDSGCPAQPAAVEAPPQAPQGTAPNVSGGQE